jgi:hypothetical protein
MPHATVQNAERAGTCPDKGYFIPQISYDQSWAICGFNIACSSAFRTEAVVAALFSYSQAGPGMVDTLPSVGRVAGLPMRLASKESRCRLPVRRNRRRALHLTDVR